MTINTPQNTTDQNLFDEEQVSHSDPGAETLEKLENNTNILLDWNGPDDPENPKNFSTAKKVYITISLALLVFVVTFSSSILSPASGHLVEEFGISKEVSVLATSLNVLGFAFGPTIFGPASEVLGRKYPLSAGIFLFAIFTIPVARASNVATLFVCRFFSGFFGSSGLAITGGTLADIWHPFARAIAVAGIASTTFLGPVLGPIVGGFITKSHLGWRWTQWVVLIIGLCFVLNYFVGCPETSSLVLLSRREKKTRNESHVSVDAKRIDFKHLARIYILKPWIMIAQEPILALMTFYMGFIYAFPYLCFEAYPIAFQQERGWNLGVGALPFIATDIGVFTGIAIIIFDTKTRVQRKMQTHGEVPEERLVPMMLGSILMPAGMFWFAWTSNPNITWVPQVISGVFLGCGILLIFMQGMNYMIDVYKVSANSAISINAMFRSLLGAGFPLFANSMFNNLGVPWAMSVLGFLSLAMVPVPFLLYIYGAKIRQWSKFCIHDL